MSRDFKIGDRVRRTGSWGKFPKGATGVVTGLPGADEGYVVRWDDPALEAIGQTCRPIWGGRWGKSWLEWVGCSFDPKLPAVTASGVPVHVTVVPEDTERPFRAEIDGMLLSFNPDGSFITGTTTKVDLMNAP